MASAGPKMASSWVSLPFELIDQILGYDDTSHVALSLWLVGNRALHTKLSASMTFMELRSARRLALCRLPHFLPNLRSLRHLIIDRQFFDEWFTLFDRSRTVSILRELPSAMESIIFRFFNSSLIFFPTVASDGTLPPHISINSTFPQLKRLHLDHDNKWSVFHLQQLPPTITDLTVVLPTSDKEAKEVMRLLPAALVSLQLVVLEGLDTIPIELLPPNLESLLLSGYARTISALGGHSTFAALPRSLVYLGLPLYHRPARGRCAVDGNFMYRDSSLLPLSIKSWKPKFASALPPLIHRVAIAGFKHSTTPMQAFLTLPKDLQELVLAENISPLGSALIQQLPRRLTTLSAPLMSSDEWSASAFPPTLTSLFIHGRSNFTSSPQLALLPSLIDLTAYSIPVKDVVNMTSSLRALTFTPSSLDESSFFPPNLTCLNIYNTRLGHYAELDALEKVKDGIMDGTNEKTKSEKENKSVNKIWPDWHQKFYPLPPPGCIVAETLRIAQLANCSLLRTLVLKSMLIPIGDLVHLPDRLTSLNLSFLVADPLFDPASDATLRRARHLLDIAPEREIYDFRVLGEKQQVTIFDLLPRSVTLLWLGGDLSVPTAAWSRLPRRLSSLHLRPAEASSQDLLKEICLTRVQTLTLWLIDLDDAHVRLFPLGLRHIDIRIAASNPSFTARSYYCIPLLQNLYKHMNPKNEARTSWEVRLRLVATLEDVADFDGLRRLEQERDLV